MTQRSEASLLADVSLFLGDIDRFVAEHPETCDSLIYNPCGVLIANRIQGIADSTVRMSEKARHQLPSGTLRWIEETAETATRYDMWHNIDQEGYRQFISEGLHIFRQAVDKTLTQSQLAAH